MTTTVPVSLLLMFLNAAVGMRRLSSSAVLINEVTNQGSETDLCAGEDWVELVNVVGAPSSVAGMALDDSSSSPDLGIVSDLPAEVAAGKALVLGQGSCPAEIPAHGYLVVCKGEKAFTFDAAGAVVASYLEGCGFGFGNGNTDDVVLFSSAEGNVTADMIVDRTGVWNDALGNNPTAAQSLGRNGAGDSAVLINEVTNQGSETDLCAGEDWVELVNVVGAPSSVAGMALDDSSSSPDLGIVSDLPAEVAAGKALVLGQGSCPAEIPANGYLVVCKGEKAFTFDAAGAVVASYLEGCGFGFGNGNSDDVVLFSSAEGNVTADMIVDRTGVWNDALGNNPTAAQSLGRNGAGDSAVLINEVTNQGSETDLCAGEDWVELVNVVGAPSSVAGMALDDSSSSPDLGIVSDLPAEVAAGKALVLGQGSCLAEIPAHGYLVVCKGEKAFTFDAAGAVVASYLEGCGFGFGNGNTDDVVLFSSAEGNVTADMIVDRTGVWNDALGNNPTAAQSLGRNGAGDSAVLINEVTNQGSETDLCAGEDWVELVNVVGAPSSVAGMALDDSSSSPDLGIVSDLPAEVAAGKALVLGQGSCPAEIPAHGYLVVCKGEKAFTFDAAGAVVASYLEGCGFGFGNGNTDDVVLFSSAEGNVTADMIVDRTGVWNDALGNNPTAAQSLGRINWAESAVFVVFDERTLGVANPFFVEQWDLSESSKAEDLSGVAIIPGGAGDIDSIIFCNNNPLNSDVAKGDEKLVRLFEYTLPTPSSPPKLMRMVRMDGFDDVEGLALVEKTSTGVRLVVTEEGRLNLVLITLPLMGAADGVVVEATVDYAAVPPEDMYAVSLVDDAKSTNRGLEGVAYDPAGFFYTLTEELPMRVLRVDMRTRETVLLFSGPPRLASGELRIQSHSSSIRNDEQALLSGVATDIAGMTYDYKSRSLIFVSHEGIDDGSIGPATVFTSDLSGKLLSGPLKLQGAQPEGIVMKDASTMYIIGEPAEVQMYVSKKAGVLASPPPPSSPLRGDCPPGLEVACRVWTVNPAFA
ncbi:hypothetical protein EMIHUDRAFT_201201 [Emiliania huxleyi CCMP1516]|uniref:LTD domain-containing protein n=2 Tax=Emiliania huxleyi TaxID=2903 RepID=A0A0D3KMC1_EMIH1|nr:hypothetical protein EMIHUDRAFT_201201 [Emiliania huxleyi CCMP1516]EOD36906.1 hypothetical protein EMIHUDRAFT_201201 [Emiliania huxleyi CCMP1516]|eukprot:XP_005789335.1 hypothetical protein EMIHUDRAFT_201201 [Emiliania huxleyi CCMP1516]